MTPPVFLDAPDGGSIGLMPCPGRFDTVENDAARIVDAEVDLVLSLIQASEHPETLARLPALLASRGIAWRHLPIVDFGVPDKEMDIAWRDLARDIHDRLDRGDRVLVHCWGGLGRSGTIVLRILVERGEDADGALARLRSARKGAVETGPQLAWAQAGRLRVRPIAGQMDGK